MAKYKINKQKCLDIKNCGICMQTCPGAIQEGDDGKSEIIDQEKIEKCGGESVCPMRAIERIDKENEKKENKDTEFVPGRDFGRRGRGKGMGRGTGRRRKK